MSEPRLIIPALGPLYAGLATPMETLLRLAAGILLAVHGYGKITNPFGAVDMVQGLGFYPGTFWSPLLSATEFFGGIFLAFGFLTRPAALATSIILLVTIYAHGLAWGDGLMVVEKSILWAAITLYFAVRGANGWSVDARIGRQF